MGNLTVVVKSKILYYCMCLNGYLIVWNFVMEFRTRCININGRIRLLI